MISVVIPTFNEAENILPLMEAIQSQMKIAGVPAFEVLVMDDDSPDGTANLVESAGKPFFRAINRRGKPRGLSQAAIDGFAAAGYPVIALMDADGSHPAEALPKLFAALQNGANLAIGSRYVAGGGTENWPFKRRLASRVACLLASPLTPVKDATSGFFAFRRAVIEGIALNPRGFKIGLEIFARGKHGGKIIEVPYLFKDRRAGSSKLSGPVMGAYVWQLLSLLKLRFS